MTRHTPALLAALGLLPFAQVTAQTCAEEHYRWTAKTTLAQQGDPATATTPVAMLEWVPLDLWRPAPGADDCTPRSGNELTTYAVTGWARSWHIEKGASGDLDWHIELTQGPKSKSTRCVVVEIPDSQYGAVYATARQSFLDLIVNSKIDAKKQIVPAVRLTVVGPAFFDAQHRGAKGTGNPPHKHGNCNSSAAALWEIHPVYQVTAPAP